MRSSTRRNLLLIALALVLAGNAPALLASSQDPGKARERPGALSLDVDGGRWLRLAPPPQILDDELVVSELTSGLTTTFAFLVDPRGGAPDGGARVQIRYHLWDEAFHCQAGGLGGQSDVRVLPSMEEVRKWWAELRLRSLDLGPQGRNQLRPRQVRITLDVIPFSSQEQEDTRRWLEEALGREGRSPSEAGSQEGAGGAIGQVFNVLIATSIRRKAVTSYRWNLPVPREASR